MSRSITFTIESDVLTEIMITENDNGTLTFDINVLDGGLIGDLRALFFDLNGLTSDSALGVYSGADVTDYEFEEEGVDTLGRDANIKGSVVNELGDFDVGIEFGTSGMSQDDIQSTSFTLAHDTSDLSLDMIDLADFGVRYTSVGEDGGSRNGSVKAGDQAAGVARDDALLVLENETGAVELLANDTGGALVGVTGASDDDGSFTAVAGGFERAVVVDGRLLGTLVVGSDGVASFAADGPDVDHLAEGETVSIDFTYETTSTDGAIATADVSLSVVGVNDAPTMADGTMAANEDGQAVTLDLSALGADIDSDNDGTDLIYTLAGSVSEGGASISGSVLTFDPGADFQDLDDGETRDVTLTVQAMDAHGAVTTGTVVVTVTGETDNHPPVAVADLLFATEDTAATLDVLANDTDPDLDPLSLATINGVAVMAGDTIATDHGELVVNGDGTLSYQADTHYSGEDSFTYTATDGTVASGPATVTLDVEAVADAPILGLASGSGGGGDPTPVPQGVSDLVNTTTVDVQQDSHIVALLGGGFVVVWASNNQDGSAWGVYGQVYDPSGAKLGGEFQINETTASWQRYPDVSASDDGGFMVTWSSYGIEGSSPYLGVAARKFDAAGNAMTGEFTVNTHQDLDQQQSRIDDTADGGHIVGWISQQATGSALDIRIQKINDAGALVGSEITVTTNADNSFDLAGLAGGGTVVTWAEQGVDGSGAGVLAQLYDAAGAAVGTAFVVNSTTADDQSHVTVEALASGGFVIAWETSTAGGGDGDIMARVHDASGNPVGGEFQVNSYSATDQDYPSITALDDGGFLVTWNSNGQDGSQGGLYAQRFDASGLAVGSEYRVNDQTTGNQTNFGRDATTVLSDGQVATVWEQDYGDVYLRLSDLPQTSDGTEGEPFAIDLSASLVDADGSEFLTIELSGFPAGSSFNLGTADGANWVIDDAETVDLSTLEMTTPDGFDGTFTLTAIARATEASNGDFAETTASVDLVIAAAYRPPLFTDGDDQINFGNPAAGAFGLVEAGTYEDGTQYAALGGDDEVYLPLTQVDADLAGYDLTQNFDLGDGDDYLRGSLLDDHVTGGSGRDSLVGLDGNDTLLGEDGNDHILGGAGDDTMDGGTGSDILNFSGAVQGIVLDTAAGTATGEGTDSFSNFEQYRLTQHDDHVTGSGMNAQFRLYGGNDVLIGGAGSEYVISGEGTNTIDGGAGIDRISYQSNSSGVVVDLAAGTASGAGFSDVLSGFEQIIGSAYDDSLTGSADENDITGGVGDDILTGGANSDRYYHYGATDGVDTLTDFDPDEDRLYISGAASDFVYDPGTGSLLHVTDGYGVIFGDPATRPDAVSFDGTEIVFSGGGTFTSNGGAIQVEAFDFIASGTTGGNRLVSVAQDGTMAQFDFLANNGGYAYGTAVGDINGDGLDDVFMSGDWSGAVIYYADGTGGFTNAGVTLAGQFQGQVEIADIDNDGDGDLYVQNGLGAAEVWRNDGGSFTNTFSYTNIGSTGSYRTSGDARFADVNGDGALDMFLLQTDNQNPIADKLFFGDGTGGFTAAAQALPTASGYGLATLADVNNNGAVDYVAGTATGIFVAMNDGAGTFTTAVTDLGAAFNGGIELADFNGDGYLDAVRQDPDAGTGLELWLGDGTDTFVFNGVIATGVGGYAGGISVGDFTGDGIADIVRSVNGGIETLENDGFGNFTQADVIALSGFVFGDDLGLV